MNGLRSPTLRLSPPTGLQEPALAKAGDPLRRVDELLKAGYIHVVDGDLKSYFDTIPKAAFSS